MKPKFSILIPTRNRGYTLKSTIKTCLEQNYTDMEVVICDNASNDGTGKIIDKIKEKRLKYFYFKDLVSMSMNWERGLKLISGSHVILIGSDDALIPNCLDALAKLIELTKSQAINWERPYYNWPDVKIPGGENNLYIPPVGFKQRIIRMNSKTELRKVLKTLNNYSKLPTLYNSVIDMRLIEKIAASSKDNIYFQCQSPDIYSGIANSLFLDDYFHSLIPFSMNGGSASSTGVAGFGTRGDNAIVKEFRALSKECNQDFFEFIPEVACIATAIADAFFRARENFPNLTSSYSVDISFLYQNVFSRIKNYYSDNEARIAYEKLEIAQSYYNFYNKENSIPVLDYKNKSELKNTNKAGSIKKNYIFIKANFLKKIKSKFAGCLNLRIIFRGFGKKLPEEYDEIYQISSVLSLMYEVFYKDIDNEYNRTKSVFISLIEFRKKISHLTSILKNYF